MKNIAFSEKEFDLKKFVKAIFASVKYFDSDLSEDVSPDLLLGINSEGDILYLDKNDLYTTDNKLTVEVLRIKLREGFSICFSFTNIFAEIEENEHLTFEGVSFQ